MKKRTAVVGIFIIPLVVLAGVMPSYAALTYEEVYVSETGTNKILIVVNNSIFEPIESSLGQYIMDLEAEGYNVTATKFESGTPEELKDYIRLFPDLEGVVFIGDLPVAWYEIENDWDCGYTRFPIDLFYMELDGEWLDTDGNGKYDTHNEGAGDFQPEIWLGRLTASPLWHSELDEAGLLINYFSKNHTYRTERLPVQHRALLYFDDDWSKLPEVRLNLIYDDVVAIVDPAASSAGDYKNRLTEGYEWIHVIVHSNENLHFFHGSDTVDFYDIRSIDPATFFYSLNACSNCRYTTPNYMGGHYVFADTYGLAAIGSTKLCDPSIAGGYHVYRHLAPDQRKNIGTAYKKRLEIIAYNFWNNSNKMKFYGITLLGDPTLTIDPPIASIDNIATPANPYFSGSGNIRDGEIVAYSWRSNLDGYLGSENTLNSSLLTLGEHTIYFRVQDDKGRWSSEANAVFMINIPPVAYISIPGTMADTHAGEQVNFNSAGSYDTDGEIVLYRWNFGDGHIVIVYADDPVAVSHAYSTPGEYTVTLTVTDDYGAVSEPAACAVKVSERTYSILGRVVDEGGRGIEGLRVLYSARLKVYYTASNGEFIIPDVANGTYYIIVWNLGYTYIPENPQQVTITGEDVTGIEFIAIPIYDISGKVIYKVYDRASRTYIPFPIAGASIRLRPYGAQDICRIDYTDTNGEYKLEDVPSGAYIIEVAHDDYMFIPYNLEVNVSGGDKVMNPIVGYVKGGCGGG